MTATVIETTPAGTKRGAKPRKTFDLKTAIGVDGKPIPLNDKGQLTNLPNNWAKSYAALKRGDFASKMLFLQHRLDIAQQSVKRANDRILDIQMMIKEEVEGVDPIVQKRRRLDKLRAELAALEAQVAESNEG